ncbi:hypothetical protein GIB67_030525 [Kingdonia uniflora]|uniref:Tf2-1-like SH3-like domain-containing protein n=1 Tax=Kingdonia uniflora TaxID=39325 RepID=A0A7J7LD50_9MAGN|nr:hypothetical protein GIB67_030525 [Kingdonia uniflora]
MVREVYHAIDLVGGKEGDVLESSRSKSYEEVATLMREVHMINDFNCQEAQPRKTNSNLKPSLRIRRTIENGLITSPTTKGVSQVTTVAGIQEREVPITDEIAETRDLECERAIPERVIALDPLPYQRVRRGVPPRSLTLCGSLTKSDASSPGINEYWKKHALFYTRVKAQGKGLGYYYRWMSVIYSWADLRSGRGMQSILGGLMSMYSCGKVFDKDGVGLSPGLQFCCRVCWSIRVIHEEVWQHLANVYAGVNERVDRHRREVIFSPWDLVMLYIEKGQCTCVVSKLLLRKSGPYRIIERIGDNAYELDIPGAHSKVVNVKLLTQFYDDIPSYPVTPSPNIELTS